MSTSEERLKILNMIAEGKITAEEGAQLLKALAGGGPRKQAAGGEPLEAGMMRVRVTDSRSGRLKASINIPMSLINVGLRMGARFAPDLDGLDFQEVVQAIKRGARGKIVEVEDETDGERVEIFVE
jgi:hypothetical protein